MEIRIGGRLLDIEPQEITMQWKSFVFADAIGDQYSTDITLPRSANNTAILQPFGLLDGVTAYNRRIPCAVSIDIVGVDGYLQIVSLAKNELTATLWLSPFPYELVDKKIRDIIHDANYIRPWDLIAPTSFTSGHAGGLQRSLFIDKANQWALPWSLRYSEFMAALSSATGVTLNMPFSEVFRVVAATPKVSPYNDRQAIYSYVDESETPNVLRMHASQHVCTDVESPIEDVEDITVTRDCTAKFTPYQQFFGVYVNGAIVYTDTTNPNTPANPGPSFTYNFTKGDKFSVVFPPISGVMYDGAVLIEWSNYAVEDTDGQDELIFPGYIPNYEGTMKTVPSVRYAVGGEDCDGQSGRVRLSWSYMDFWWCVGSMTFRELVNALCHLAGAGVESGGDAIAFSAGRSEVCDGDITEMRTAPGSVGKRTLLKWGKNSTRGDQELAFPSDFLADSVTVFQSVLFGAKAVSGDSIHPGVAIVPLFELQDDPDTTHHVKWQDCGAVMLKEMDYYDRNGNHRYALAPLPAMKWCGVDEIGDIPVEVEMETLADLRGAMYFYFEGRKYILVSADTDTDTGFTYAVGLLVKPS